MLTLHMHATQVPKLAPPPAPQGNKHKDNNMTMMVASRAQSAPCTRSSDMYARAHTHHPHPLVGVVPLMDEGVDFLLGDEFASTTGIPELMDVFNMDLEMNAPHLITPPPRAAVATAANAATATTFDSLMTMLREVYVDKPSASASSSTSTSAVDLPTTVNPHSMMDSAAQTGAGATSPQVMGSKDAKVKTEEMMDILQSPTHFHKKQPKRPRATSETLPHMLASSPGGDKHTHKRTHSASTIAPVAVTAESPKATYTHRRARSGDTIKMLTKQEKIELKKERNRQSAKASRDRFKNMEKELTDKVHALTIDFHRLSNEKEEMTRKIQLLASM